MEIDNYSLILTLTMAGKKKRKSKDEKVHEELEKKIKKSEKEIKEQKEEIKTLQQKMTGEAKEFRKQFADRTLKLMTSGFGLVSALAWNELIKEIIKQYIQPVFGKDSGIISLLIYAVVVTFLAVLVTYNLSKIADSGKK